MVGADDGSKFGNRKQTQIDVEAMRNRWEPQNGSWSPRVAKTLREKHL